jgi:hypothetical protein
MERARDSISNTVTEIKENVTQQYENVKDALDWREHFRRQPLAWSLGAAGVGFFIGYGRAAAIRGDEDDPDDVHYATNSGYELASGSVARPNIAADNSKANGHDEGPGLLERFRETSAYERLSKEASAIGDRVIEELSETAQAVVLPALLKKIKQWVGLDLSNKSASMDNQSQKPATSYRDAPALPGEF